ncbi:hypothetical protein WMY93_011352 [Mugilogobius chulae]|uniref:Uncharacterized protein n=1 Tax=Mugilogobius chulae TaxID=88201 RepID=A0AAW0P839_9GOBI
MFTVQGAKDFTTRTGFSTKLCAGVPPQGVETDTTNSHIADTLQISANNNEGETDMKAVQTQIETLINLLQQQQQQQQPLLPSPQHPPQHQQQLLQQTALHQLSPSLQQFTQPLHQHQPYQLLQPQGQWNGAQFPQTAGHYFHNPSNGLAHPDREWSPYFGQPLTVEQKRRIALEYNKEEAERCAATQKEHHQMLDSIKASIRDAFLEQQQQQQQQPSSLKESTDVDVLKTLARGIPYKRAPFKQTKDDHSSGEISQLMTELRELTNVISSKHDSGDDRVNIKSGEVSHAEDAKQLALNASSSSGAPDPEQAAEEEEWIPEQLVNDNCREEDVIESSYCCKGQWNNLALGNLDFKYVPSELIGSSASKCDPRVGDVCVRLLPVVSRGEEFAAIVDLYNTYIVKGSSFLAKMCISRYTGTNELYIPVIPIHTLVSEWNKSLQQFHDLISCERSAHPIVRRRNTVISNIAEIALKNVPIVSDHLWFVMHCIVSKPHLIGQVLQLVGSIASRSGTVYHTGEVENVTVPGQCHSARSRKLYLIAKPVPIAAGSNLTTVLGDNVGVTLGLIWVTDEEDLHDHLQNAGHCHYIHIGTESGNTFRCNGFCHWHYYNHKIFGRMAMIGQRVHPILIVYFLPVTLVTQPDI